MIGQIPPPPGYEDPEEKKKKVLSAPVPQAPLMPSAPPGYEEAPVGYEEVPTKPTPQAPTLIQQKLTPPSQYKRESVFEIPAKGQAASNIVYQALRGMAEEMYLNIPKFPKPAELTEWEDIAEGAGRFAGFIFGMPMKLGKMGTQLLFKALKKPGKKVAGKLIGKRWPRVGKVLERIVAESAQLGIASAVSDIEDVKGMPERFKSGAIFGAIFGGMRWIDIKKMPLLSQILRQTGTRALARTANLYKMPYEDIRQWTTPEAAQRVFDEALFSWFSAKGTKPGEIFRTLRQVEKEVVKNKLPIKVWSPYADPTAQEAMKKIPSKFISLPSGEVIPAEMFSWKLDVTGIKKILPELKALPEARVTKTAELEKLLKERKITSRRKPEELKNWLEMKWEQKKEPTTRYEGALPEKPILEQPAPIEYKYGGFDIKKALDYLESTLEKKHKAAIAEEQVKIEKGKPVRPIMPEEEIDPTITKEIDRVARIRRAQDLLRSKESGKRFQQAKEIGQLIGGEEGFHAEKAKLKGEYPKKKFQHGIYAQESVDNLMNKVRTNRRLNYMESIRARDGLEKLLGKQEGLPQPKEIELLKRVFPKAFRLSGKDKATLGENVKKYALEGMNVPRALMASFDLSFPFRQGVFVAARHPILFSKAFMKQFKTFGSEKAYQATMEEIRSRPEYDLMMNGDAVFGKEFKARLALTERGLGAKLGAREEPFIGAELAERIPLGIGLGVKASGRAFSGFGNRLRADLFSSMIKRAKKVGRNPWKEPKLVEDIIRFVNAGTGRGGLKNLGDTVAILNAGLFSPRLISSRLSLLNPAFYAKLDPLARKEALESLFAFTGMILTTLTVAKMAGASVETNMTSADWGKIKIGNTRIDIMGGFQQYIRAAAQLISGKVTSTTTGKVTELGKGFKPLDRMSLVGRALEYKLAPLPSFAVNIIRARTSFGDPVKTPKEIGGEVVKRLVPMVIQDVIDLAREDPDLLPLAGLGFFGFGLQSYSGRKKAYKRKPYKKKYYER